MKLYTMMCNGYYKHWKILWKKTLWNTTVSGELTFSSLETNAFLRFPRVQQEQNYFGRSGRHANLKKCTIVHTGRIQTQSRIHIFRFFFFFFSIFFRRVLFFFYLYFIRGVWESRRCNVSCKRIAPDVVLRNSSTVSIEIISVRTSGRYIIVVIKCHDYHNSGGRTYLNRNTRRKK